MEKRQIVEARIEWLLELAWEEYKKYNPSGKYLNAYVIEREDYTCFSVNNSPKDDEFRLDVTVGR